MGLSRWRVVEFVYNFKKNMKVLAVRDQEISQSSSQRTLLNLYIIFVIGVLFLLLLFYADLRQRFDHNITTNSTLLLQLLAGSGTETDVLFPDTSHASLDYLLIDNLNNQIHVSPTNTAQTSQSSAWNRWYRRIVFEALHQDSSFSTIDPTNTQWFHTALRTADDPANVLVLQQPYPTVYGRFYSTLAWVAVFAGIAAGSPLVCWGLFSHRFVTLLNQLEDVSEAIRWRGYLHDDEKNTLQLIAQRKIQFGTLARSILDMEQENHKRFMQISTLLNVSHTMVTSLRIDEVIPSILEQVQKLFQCDRYAVITLDERTGLFRIRASKGLSDKYTQELRIGPSEPNSPSMRALRNQVLVQVTDIETDLTYREFRQRARREGFRSVLAIPLYTRYAPPSVIVLYKDRPYQYSFSERELGRSFANHASLALDNAALFAQSDEQLQLQTQRLEAIVESLTDALILEGVDGSIIYMNQKVFQMLSTPADTTAPPDNLLNIVTKLLENTPDANKVSERFFEVYRQGTERFFDLTRLTPDGHKQELRVHFFDVRDAGNRQLGFGQIWQDRTRDKQLDQMKSALLTTASHELRTPLATIKGYVTTLLANDVEWSDASKREFLEMIGAQTDRLTQLVKNILDVSQIEAGLIKLSLETISLNELIPEALASFPVATQERVHLALSPDLPPLSLDASRISTVIRNLIENAVKYSPLNAPIEITTCYQQDHVLLTVRDYGEGIAPNNRDQVFEQFYRVDNRLSRITSGFGLGLAICKGFIEAHQGRIWFTESAPGTAFTFSIPTYLKSE